MNSVLSNQEPKALISYMKTYFKRTPPDISLFSEDNFEIPIHIELFYQTQLMRLMIKSTNSEYCCSKAAVICPMPKEDLELIVMFLYTGQLFSKSNKAATQLSKYLEELFGFPPIYLSSKNVEFIETPDPNAFSSYLDHHKKRVHGAQQSDESLTSFVTKNEKNEESSARKKSRKQSLTSTSIRHEFSEDIFTIKTEPKDILNEKKLDEKNILDPLATSFTQKGSLNHDRNLDIKVEGIESDIICNICSKGFNTKQALATHVSKSHRDACNVCFEQFESKQDLEGHMVKAHSISDFQETRRCVICDISYERKGLGRQKLREHMKSEHNIGFKCQTCQMKFPSKLKLKQHKKEHKAAKPDNTETNLCSLCGKEFKNKQTFQHHVSKRSCKQWHSKKCLICNITFESRSLMLEHIAAKHQYIVLYNCPECNSRFMTKKGLKTHTPCNTENVCPICGKIFTTPTSLRTHIAYIHEGKIKPRKFKCTLCEKAYRRSVDLQNHMSVHERKILQCLDCTEEFNSKKRLERHIAQKHDRSKLFKCSHCDSAFVQEKHLLDHIAFVHEKKISNLCSLCGKNFRTQGELKKHIKYDHELEGQKTHECEECEKTFKNKNVLRSHVKITHEGKRVKCPVCEKPFVTKRTMETHFEAVHEKKKPHVCDICNERFAQKSHLVTHRKGKHKCA